MESKLRSTKEAQVSVFLPRQLETKMTRKRFILTESLLLICIYTSFSNGYTWFEAREACQEKNDSLTIKKAQSDGYYWTGNYKRISKWIKLIGCCKMTDVTAVRIFNMVNSSAGLCQELCGSDDYATFAVQSGSCFCLNNDYLNRMMSTTSATLCNFTCNNHFDDVLSTECGGNTTVNVFSTGTEVFYSQDNYCLSLQCGAQSKVFKEKTCNTALKAVCQGKESLNNYTGWRNHLTNCKKRNRYLFGNVNMSNTDLSCQYVNATFGDQHWVGVVRERYLSKDRGQYDINKPQVLMCEKCNRTGCLFTRCLQRLRNVVFCNKLEVTLPTQLSTPSRTENGESLESILAPVITITVFGIIGGVLLFIYVRKKRQHVNSYDRQQDTNNTEKKIKVQTNSESKKIEDKYSDYTEGDQKNNYLVLESSHPSHEVADEMNEDCSSPYNDAEEGDYDHLRETKSRQKERDDTYHHALHVHVDDSSNYDVTRRKYDQETENMYDKTGGNNLDSEYGYNKVLPNNEECHYDKTFTTLQI
ncbi:uncharacterized protein LOC125655776 isoform X2 [Ostrea edulis]|uniref:uncharacterized protein LOC125655776 isoform X2 n=2 Tax=Ostrea edulis TaxID=37623 RepID=UPI0024AFE3C8|nr:uncharacterized protein LOC125655776 isoform X2 [Ostrea edulis]